MNMRIASITACNAEFFFYSYLGLLPLQSTKFSKYLSQIMSDSYVRRHAAELKEGRIKLERKQKPLQAAQQVQ